MSDNAFRRTASNSSLSGVPRRPPTPQRSHNYAAQQDLRAPAPPRTRPHVGSDSDSDNGRVNRVTSANRPPVSPQSGTGMKMKPTTGERYRGNETARTTIHKPMPFGRTNSQPVYAATTNYSETEISMNNPRDPVEKTSVTYTETNIFYYGSGSTPTPAPTVNTATTANNNNNNNSNSTSTSMLGSPLNVRAMMNDYKQTSDTVDSDAPPTVGGTQAYRRTNSNTNVNNNSIPGVSNASTGSLESTPIITKQRFLSPMRTVPQRSTTPSGAAPGSGTPSLNNTQRSLNEELLTEDRKAPPPRAAARAQTAGPQPRPPLAPPVKSLDTGGGFSPRPEFPVNRTERPPMVPNTGGGAQTSRSSPRRSRPTSSAMQDKEAAAPSRARPQSSRRPTQSVQTARARAQQRRAAHSTSPGRRASSTSPKRFFPGAKRVEDNYSTSTSTKVLIAAGAVTGVVTAVWLLRALFSGGSTAVPVQHFKASPSSPHHAPHGIGRPHTPVISSHSSSSAVDKREEALKVVRDIRQTIISNMKLERKD